MQLEIEQKFPVADLQKFAKALTGWTVGGPQTARLAGAGFGGGGQGAGRNRQRAASAGIGNLPQEMAAQAGSTVFAEALHEPGDRTVLGKKYGGPEKQQAAAILDDLAKHPATAHHIAAKLVRHFVADQPPEPAVKKIAAVFIKTNGNLAAVAKPETASRR